jgi:hypothetical protein
MGLVVLGSYSTVRAAYKDLKKDIFASGSLPGSHQTNQLTLNDKRRKDGPCKRLSRTLSGVKNLF